MDLRQKLQLKPGTRGVVLGCPDDVELGVPHNADGTDFAIVFVRTVADIEAHARTLVNRLTDDGLLWFCYPKRTSGVPTDITRDHGWQAVFDLGWRAVRQIAVDGTWSAIRFREERYVKAR